MASSRRWKIIRWSIAGLLLFVFFLLPPLLGLAYRGKVEREISEALNAPVTLGSLSIHVYSLGATLSDLAIGKPDPIADNKPLAHIDSLRAHVSFGTVLGRPTHVTAIEIAGVELNLTVDQEARSSLKRLLDALPPPKARDELPINYVRILGARINTYLHDSIRPEKRAEKPDSKLEVGMVTLNDLVLPKPDQPAKSENWSKVRIATVALSAPLATEPPSGSVADGARVREVVFEFALPQSKQMPLKVRNLYIDTPEVANAYSKDRAVPALTRALVTLQHGLGSAEKSKKGTSPSSATGLLIKNLTVAHGRLETRGPDGLGRPAFWRLSDLSVDATDLALGPDVRAENVGHIKLHSQSESSSGPGSVALSVLNIAGGYPRWTFECDYRAEGIAAPAFSQPVEQSKYVGIKAGTLLIELSGSANKGKLNLEGSLTLSEDFEMTGVVGQFAKLARGTPLKPVRVRGTLEHPDAVLPTGAGMFEDVFGTVLTGGADHTLVTLQDVTGIVPGEVGEISKFLKPATDLLDKVPVLKEWIKSE